MYFTTPYEILLHMYFYFDFETSSNSKEHQNKFMKQTHPLPKN